MDLSGIPSSQPAFDTTQNPLNEATSPLPPPSPPLQSQLDDYTPLFPRRGGGRRATQSQSTQGATPPSQEASSHWRSDVNEEGVAAELHLARWLAQNDNWSRFKASDAASKKEKLRLLIRGMVGAGFRERTPYAVTEKIRTLQKGFKSALHFMNATGRGIYSVEWQSAPGKKKILEKRDKLCRYYDLFMAAFGTRAGFLANRRYTSDDIEQVERDFDILLGTTPGGAGTGSDDDESDDSDGTMDRVEAEGQRREGAPLAERIRDAIEDSQDDEDLNMEDLGLGSTLDDNHIPNASSSSSNRSTSRTPACLSAPPASTSRCRDTPGARGKGAVEGSMTQAVKDLTAPHQKYMDMMAEARTEERQVKERELELKRREVEVHEREGRARAIASRAQAIASLIQGGMSPAEAKAFIADLED